jgi:hypothetical protein
MMICLVRNEVENGRFRQFLTKQRQFCQQFQSTTPCVDDPHDLFRPRAPKGPARRRVLCPRDSEAGGRAHGVALAHGQDGEINEDGQNHAKRRI